MRVRIYIDLSNLISEYKMAKIVQIVIYDIKYYILFLIKAA